MTSPNDRLRAARIGAGFLTARKAVDRFGWKYSTYAAHESGQNGITPDAAAQYAQAFKVDPSWLLMLTDRKRNAEITESASALVPVPVDGTIEAGAFREVDDFVQVEHVVIYEPRDRQFPSARQRAFDVAGDSMDALTLNGRPRPILPGDRVVTIDFDGLEGRVPLQDGMVVVVEQSRDGGHLRERSVKQVEIYNDRLEFHPRSTNPKHKPIVVPRDLHADDGRMVRILALVRAIRSEMEF